MAVILPLISSVIAPPVTSAFGGGSASSVQLLSSGSMSPFVSTSRSTTATYFDAAGAMQGAPADTPRYTGPRQRLLIEESRTNLVPNSQNGFSGSPAPGNTSATSTEVPALHAGSVVRKNLRSSDTATNTDDQCGFAGTNQASLVANTAYTWSAYVWVPAGMTFATAPYLRTEGGGFTGVQNITIDLSKRDQWQRLSGTVTSPATIAGAPFIVVRLGGNSPGAYVYSTCPQFAAASFPTSYFPTSGTVATRAADDVTAELGAWFRNGETATNHFTRSDDMAQAWGTKSGVTVTSDATTAPDNSANGDLIVESATTADHYVERGISPLPGNQDVTLSVYLKAAGRAAGLLYLYSSDYSQGVRVQYANLDTAPTLSNAGAFGAAGTSVYKSSSATSAGNGWWRFTLTGFVTHSSATTTRYRVQLLNGSTTFAGDGVSGVFAFGGQVEASGFAASYLPTAAAPVSRQMIGAGTFVVEASLVNGTLAQLPFVSMNDGAANMSNALTLRYNQTAAQILGVGTINGRQDTTPGVTALNPSQLVKVALAFDQSGYSVCVDGQTPVSFSTPFPMWAMTKLAIGRHVATSIYGNAEYAGVQYRPYRASAAELQALTSQS